MSELLLSILGLFLVGLLLAGYPCHIWISFCLILLRTSSDQWIPEWDQLSPFMGIKGVCSHRILTFRIRSIRSPAKVGLVLQSC